uniref:Transposable element protein, putative, MuDR n=1 Tax=Oryza sativa subsp. japonica TaxID=39947 RepID=Q33A98_ORYSJ|nr:Transposable element protein, putative, MuDR [Oryza sativa Japonica Group]
MNAILGSVQCQYFVLLELFQIHFKILAGLLTKRSGGPSRRLVKEKWLRPPSPSLHHIYLAWQIQGLARFHHGSPFGWTLTTYLLEIKLARDRKNARVKYDWFIFNKMIDSNAMSYKDFVADIANSYPWGPNETVTIGYVNMVHKISHHVTTDQDMLEMFEKFVDIKVIPMIIRIHGMNENIDELDHTLVKANICVPDTSSLATPSQVDFSQPSSSTLPSHILVPSDKESEDESWATSEDEPEDASEDDGVNESEDESMASDGMPEHIPSTIYDKDDTPMILGSIYSNIDEFRLAIAQHAIKFRLAKCAAQGCKWRIHASVVADGVTIMVKTNPFPHECSSTRRSETIKAASKFWICEKEQQPGKDFNLHVYFAGPDPWKGYCWLYGPK